MAMGWLSRVLATGVGATLLSVFLRAIAKTPLALIEDAASGWINRQLADWLGVQDPTVTQVVDFVSAWGPAFLIAALLFWLLVREIGRRFVSGQFTVVPQEASLKGLPGREAPLHSPPNDGPNPMPISELCNLASDSIGMDMTRARDDIYYFSQALREAGTLGSVHFYGRKLQSGWSKQTATTTHPRVEIPSEHFQDFWIDLLPLTGGLANFEIQTHYVGGNYSAPIYSDLAVDRQEAIRWLNTDAERIMGEMRDARGGGYQTLSDAVMSAWERIRSLPYFDGPPSSYVNEKTLRDYYERDPLKLPHFAASVIFNSADPPIPIEGVWPPRVAREIIPPERAAGYMFSDDATVMFDVLGREKPMNERSRYVDLRVKRADIERRIKQIEEDNGNG